MRERVGLIDMTSFGKIAVEGPGAAALLERVCDAHVDRGPGSVVYTQFLNERGGIVADVTVTRLGEQRFRVVTGAAAVDSDLGWLRLHMRDGDAAVELRDETDALCVIGMWGPHARDVLQAVTEDDVVGGRLPVRTRARPGRWAGRRSGPSASPTSASSDMSCTQSRGGGCRCGIAWRAAGARYGIRPVGYRVLDSLRMEKGYRAFGSDLTAGDTPDEAGLGFCVALERKGEFIGARGGRGAAGARPRAPAAHAARRRGRATSASTAARRCWPPARWSAACAAPPTATRSGRMIASAYLPRELAPDTPLDGRGPGRAACPRRSPPDVLYDPENARVRA